MVSFAQRLRSLREERDISQLELARRLKLSNSTISQYETKGRLPEPRILEMLADFFGVSVDYLLGRTDVRQPVAREEQAQYGDDLDQALQGLRNRGKIHPDDLVELKRFIEYLRYRREEEGKQD